jgi:hypothetical protein
MMACLPFNAACAVFVSDRAPAAPIRAAMRAHRSVRSAASCAVIDCFKCHQHNTLPALHLAAEKVSLLYTCIQTHSALVYEFSSASISVQSSLYIQDGMEYAPPPPAHALIRSPASTSIIEHPVIPFGRLVKMSNEKMIGEFPPHRLTVSSPLPAT